MAVISNAKQVATHKVVVDNDKATLHSAHDAETSATAYADDANAKAKALGVSARYKVVTV